MGKVVLQQIISLDCESLQHKTELNVIGDVEVKFRGNRMTVEQVTITEVIAKFIKNPNIQN